MVQQSQLPRAIRATVVAALLAAGLSSFATSQTIALDSSRAIWGLPLPTNDVRNPELRFVDLTGDGIDEIVAVEPDLGLRIFWKVGNDFFAGPLMPAPSPVLSMDLGDYDADGDTDFVTYNGQVISIHKNNGASIFRIDQSVAVDQQAARFRDLDLDGDLDITIGAAAILLNDGTGTFSTLTPPSAPFSTNTSANDWADFDADGLIDVAVATPNGSGSVDIYFFAGSLFAASAGSTAHNIPLQVVEAVTSCDANADGHLDMIVWGVDTATNSFDQRYCAFVPGSSSGPDWIRLSLTLITPSSWGTGTRPTIVHYDFDADGDADTFYAAEVFTPSGQNFAFWSLPSLVFGSANGPISNFPNSGVSIAISWWNVGLFKGLMDLDDDGNLEIVLGLHYNPMSLTGQTQLLNSYEIPPASGTPHPAYILEKISGDNMHAPFGSSFPDPIEVTVIDGVTGAPCTGVPVTFSFSSGSGLGSPSFPGFTNPTPTLFSDVAGIVSITISAAPYIPQSLTSGFDEIVATTGGAAPANFLVCTTGLQAGYSTSVSQGQTSVSLWFDWYRPDVPLIVAGEIAAAPSIPTPFGPIGTSILAPSQTLTVFDGIGLFGSPDPTIATVQNGLGGVFQIGGYFPSQLLSGLTVTFQVYGYDSALAFPESYIVSNIVALSF